MLLAIHRDYPAAVWSTHEDWQLEEVLGAYDADTYGILRSPDGAELNGPVPEGAEAIRPVPEAQS